LKLLEKADLYEVIETAESKIELKSILRDDNEIRYIKGKDINAVRGDLVLIINNHPENNDIGPADIDYDSENKSSNQVVRHYPVKKIKGRYSEVKDYNYLRMKILFDFNKNYDYGGGHYDPHLFPEKRHPLHKEFEEIIDAKKDQIENYISYNTDEVLQAFNNTSYTREKILNSEKIFEQEQGNKFEWNWELFEIYKIDSENYVSFKQGSTFRERHRGEFFNMKKEHVEVMRTLETDKDDFID